MKGAPTRTETVDATGLRERIVAARESWQFSIPGGDAIVAKGIADCDADLDLYDVCAYMLGGAPLDVLAAQPGLRNLLARYPADGAS